MKNKEPKQRLEKYSERFDNKDNEIVQGVFNPDTWGKRMVEQETLEEAKIRIYKNHWNIEHTQWIKSNFLNGFEEGAKWQQEQIIDFLHSEITERRDYTASKMCEKVIEFIEQFKKK